jgi:lysozyme
VEALLIEVPPQAVALAKQFEGFAFVPKHDPERAYVYRCPAGFLTIGFGHLCGPDHPPITRAEGEALLALDLRAAVDAALLLCPVLWLEPAARLAAVADFVFNLGAGRLQASTLRRRINQRDWLEAARELRRWVHGGGKVLPGLVARREAEARLLCSP